MLNRLSSQSSPYLVQHAENPVFWQPWDEEALQLARKEGKPILLSIGYSSCHWCHVMAHESFEDDATATVMNEHFVNIKVDREERPDLDKVYQSAHRLITQQTGGWPLTMFLDPETLVPFFGGTYFPKTPRYQLPGFADLLLRISTTFSEQRDQLDEQGGKIMAVMKRLNPAASPGELDDPELLARARAALGQNYDSRYGGFAQAPKFPMPSTVAFVLRHWSYASQWRDGDREALGMVMTTLTQMARGGIYDHVGGGFCRYSTDARWMIPHFEKMLYDNGQLLSLYADVLSIGPDALFEGAVRETAAWLLREMRHPDGPFYAALDADSEGEEGRFYVWRRPELKRLLTEDEYLVVETLYGLDKPANFEGKWNLHRHDSWRSVIARLSLEAGQANALLAAARTKLFDARSERDPPGLDDKILTAWNALAIKGLAKAGQVLAEPGWVDAAARAADFLRCELLHEGQLWATWKGGEVRHPGYLDDYANLLDALLALLEVRWRDEDLDLACTLADSLLAAFEDRDEGGFYFTSNASLQSLDHNLIYRPKPTLDDALPPGNGTAVSALATLGHLTGRSAYIEAADRALAWARRAMEHRPAGHCSLLGGLEAQVYPPQLVLLRGPEDDALAWRAQIESGYKPWRHIYVVPYSSTTTPDFLPRLVSLDERQRVTAFVCQGLSCSLPIKDLSQLQGLLEN